MESYSKSICLIVMLALLASWPGISSAQVSDGAFLEEWSVAPSISKEVTAGSTESDEFIGDMGPWQAEASTTELCGETTATASYSIDPGAVSIMAKTSRPNESPRSEIIHFPLTTPITVSAEDPAFLEVDFDSATVDVFRNFSSWDSTNYVIASATVRIELRDSVASRWRDLRLSRRYYTPTCMGGYSYWQWVPEQVVAGSPLNLADYLAPGDVLTIDSVSVYAEVYCNYVHWDKWKGTMTVTPAPDYWQMEVTAALNNLRSIRIFKPVIAPSVSTSPATDVTKESATLNGILTDDGGEACQYRFRYRDRKGDYLYTSWGGSVTSGQLFSQAISGLNPNTTYYFNAQALNSAGESEWGNQQTFVARPIETPVVEILWAQMVSPYELAIGTAVTFPKDTPPGSAKKVDLWADINGKHVFQTCDIPSLRPNGTADCYFEIDLDAEDVPRFTDNVNFKVYAAATWEGGPHAEVPAEREVQILLPVIIIHGYALTHTSYGGILHWARIGAYWELRESLIDSGYARAPNDYVTLWDPDQCGYQADKVTESEIYDIVNSWIVRATDASYAARVNLIGHCMGGLVARYYCSEQYASSLSCNVNKVIMIGTPHLGTTMFYMWAFQYDTKEEADKILKTDTNANNLLLWGEPQYGLESCLIDVTAGTPAWVPEPYESTFNPTDNPDVKYYSIYANNHKKTPYKLNVVKNGLDWYSVVSDAITMPGDKSVLEFSASAFAADPPPIGSGNHESLCNVPDVIARVLGILSER